MAEPMDPYFSVFNCHINNAHERAVAELETLDSSWAAEIRKWKSSGIMGIFDQDPTPATRKYVELVTQFVNENRDG